MLDILHNNLKLSKSDKISELKMLIKRIQRSFITFSLYCILSYALADNVFRTMLSEFNNHFILISGESGAGKTEASKKILQFYAVSCPSTRLLSNVRDRLLLSNPVLEVSGKLMLCPV